MLRYNKKRSYINLITFILLLVINGLANYLPLNNKTTGQIAERFLIYFIPASFVFNIWILIYFLLFCYAIFQMLKSQGKNPYVYFIGYWFAVSSILNATWLIFWHYEYFTLSFMTMLVLLIVLAVIYSNINRENMRAYTEDKVLVKAPFSIYLAWIIVATIANLNIMIYVLEWNMLGLSLEYWTILNMIIATLVAAVITLRFKDILFSLVFLWAFIGIGYRFSNVIPIETASWIISGILAVIIIYTIARGRGRKYSSY